MAVLVDSVLIAMREVGGGASPVEWEQGERS